MCERFCARANILMQSPLSFTLGGALDQAKNPTLGYSGPLAPAGTVYLESPVPLAQWPRSPLPTHDGVPVLAEVTMYSSNRAFTQQQVGCS